MKTIITILLLTLISVVCVAQDFDGINYQAVMRSADGQVMAHQDVSIAIELFSVQSHRIHYSEVHHLTADQYGLINTTIGKGEPISGKIGQIPWNDKDIYIRLIYIDESGMKSTMGESKLLAVPYAYHAGTAERLISDREDEDGRGDESNNYANWTLEGNHIGTGVTTHKYLGTNNFAPLEFRTNRILRGHFTPDDGDLYLKYGLNVYGKIYGADDILIDGDQKVLGSSIIEGAQEVGLNLRVKGDFDLFGIGKFNNTTESTDPTNGSVQVAGGIGIVKNINIGGIGRIWNTTPSVSPFDGALIVDGGVGIGLQLNVGKVAHIWDDSQSTNPDNGALITDGGLGVEKNINIGQVARIWDTTSSNKTTEGALIVDGATGIAKELNVGGITHLQNTTQSNTKTDGALIVAGGVGIADNTNIGGDLDVDLTANIDGVTTITDDTESTNTGDGALVISGGVGIAKQLNIGGDLKIASDLSVAGIAYFDNTTQSISTSTGAIVTKGGIGIAKNANVGGNLDIALSANIDGITTITDDTESTNTGDGALVVSGGVGIAKQLNIGGDLKIASDLSVAGIAYFDNTAQSTSTSTGAIVTKGGIGIAKNANVGGILSVAKRVEANDGIQIIGGPSGSDASFDNYPLQISGSDQGIAIKVNGSRNNTNNYVSFWDDSGLWGRIEGEDLTDLASNPEVIFQNIIYGVDIASAVVQEGSAIAGVVEETVDIVAAAGSANVCGGAGAVACPPITSFIVAGPINETAAVADLAAQSAQLASVIAETAGYNTFLQDQIGVTYQSGAGDYAEWLPKREVSERFSAGDIVGVREGLISKDISDAEQIMVISHRPIVLGNMQPEERQHMYEKVAFLGQVPVKVLGKVSKGDYILPAKNGGGYGVARSPEDMTARDYQNVVGVAWSASTNDQMDYVLTAVGLNKGDVSKVIEAQENKIVSQQQQIDDLKAQIDHINATLSRVVPNYELALHNDDLDQSDIEKQVRKEELENKLYAMKNNYRTLTVDQLAKGVEQYRTQLIAQGADPTKNHFFSQYDNNETYRIQYLNGLVDRVNTETRNKLETMERELRAELKALDMLD